MRARGLMGLYHSYDLNTLQLDSWKGTSKCVLASPLFVEGAKVSDQSCVLMTLADRTC